jgi:peptidoglycan/LPS O-acetylase OafA/YrhL
MGAWTLVVYLFHGFVVKTASYAGWDDWCDGHPWVSFVVTTALAVGIALLLAAEPVARRLNVLVDPYGAILRATEPRRRRTAEAAVAAAPAAAQTEREPEPAGAAR